MENREFRLARQGANCHVGLGHGSGESDKLYSSPKMGVTDVTVGVTVTSRLHRSYCCSRIPLLFCCYCSTLQHCSVPNVEQPYLLARLTGHPLIPRCLGSPLRTATRTYSTPSTIYSVTSSLVSADGLWTVQEYMYMYQPCLVCVRAGTVLACRKDAARAVPT